jgi:hypothetical protein
VASIAFSPAPSSGQQVGPHPFPVAGGRVAAGRKRPAEALPALERVRRYFTEKKIAYDAALATLEVAVLQLEAGRSREVRTLAKQMIWIFNAQRVHQESWQR